MPHATHLFVKSICSLQEEKNALYGGDWKRFGLLSSMFNIFRKFIRFRTIWHKGWKVTNDDSRLDTIVDLLNYLVMCETLQAEIAPAAFQELLREVVPEASLAPSMFASDEVGFRRFCNYILLPDVGTIIPDPDALHELAPQIIALGEENIEDWLKVVSRLASIHSDLTLHGAAYAHEQSNEIVLNSNHLVKAVYCMIKLCVPASHAHGMQNPHEWDAFVGRMEKTTV